VAKQNVYTLQQRHIPGAAAAFAPNVTTSVPLPLSGYITQLDCLIRVNVTDTGGALLEDPFARLIRALRIKSSGARSWVDFSDGRQWKYYSWLQYAGKLGIDPFSVSSVTADYYALIPLHIGTFPQDDFDTSVVIPAVETTDLNMEVVWGAAADIGAGITINNAEMIITVNEIALAPGEKRSLIWKKGLVMPRFEPVIVPIAQAFANLGQNNNLPVGDTLNRIVVMVAETTVNPRGLRTNAFATDLGVKFPKLREIPWESQFLSQVYRTQRKYDLAQQLFVHDAIAAIPAGQGDTRYALRGHINGVTQVDGMQLSGRAIGIDLTRAVTGDAQLSFTTSVAAFATADIHLLHYLLS